MEISEKIYRKPKQSTLAGKTLTWCRTKHTATGCIMHPAPIHVHSEKYAEINGLRQGEEVLNLALLVELLY